MRIPFENKWITGDPRAIAKKNDRCKELRGEPLRAGGSRISEAQVDAFPRIIDRTGSVTLNASTGIHTKYVISFLILKISKLEDPQVTGKNQLDDHRRYQNERTQIPHQGHVLPFGTDKAVQVSSYQDTTPVSNYHRESGARDMRSSL